MESHEETDGEVRAWEPKLIESVFVCTIL